MVVDISEREKTDGAPNEATLNSIVQQIHTVGYAVVSRVVSEDTCVLLADSIHEDVIRIREAGKPTLHEQYTGQGHLQLGLRRYAPYVRSDLIANPIIESIVATVLGSSAWLGFYNGNVNCPGSTSQPLHMDRPFAWKSPEEAAQAGQSWPPPTTTLSCSVALDEISLDNGATEIYPGTHHATEVIELLQGSRLEAHPALLEKWGPPQRMLIPAGGVVFRDPRMWHRGVPNPSANPRAMLALTYHSRLAKHWRGLLMSDMDPIDLKKCEQKSHLRVLDNGELGDGRLVFQEDTRDVLDASRNLHGIDRNIRFVDQPLRINHFLDAQFVGGARVVSEDTLTVVE